MEQDLRGAALQEAAEIALPKPILPEDTGDLSVTIRSSEDLPPVLLLGSFEER